MISLVGIETCQRPGALTKIKGKARGHSLREEYILGMRIIRADLMVYAEIGERRLKKEAQRLSMELFRRNRSQIVFSGEFPAKEKFDKFPKADTICLYESIAGAVGEAAANCGGGGGGGGGTAIFIAGKVGIREERSLLKLAEKYRYLIIVAGRDSAAICQGLRCRFGIAVIENPTDSQFAMADFAVFLSRPRKPFALKPECLIFSPDLSYSSGIKGGRRMEALKLGIPNSVLKEIPPGFDWPPIISEAIKYGFYSPDGVVALDFRLDNTG